MKKILSCILGLILSFNSYSLEKATGGCSAVKGLCRFFYEGTPGNFKQCVPIPGNSIKREAEHCRAGGVFKKP